LGFGFRISFVIGHSSFVIPIMTVSRFRTILYAVAAIVSLAGLADAGYLTLQALTGETAACGGSPDCFRVLGSSYAKVVGIPVAAFGSLAYSAYSASPRPRLWVTRARDYFLL
jgi:uncharacterized membrane protein